MVPSILVLLFVTDKELSRRAKEHRVFFHILSLYGQVRKLSCRLTVDVEASVPIPLPLNIVYVHIILLIRDGRRGKVFPSENFSWRKVIILRATHGLHVDEAAASTSIRGQTGQRFV